MQNVIREVVQELAANCRQVDIFSREGKRHIPEKDKIIFFIRELRKVIFPGYFGDGNDEFFFGYSLGNLWNVLYEQLKLAFSYENDDPDAVKRQAKEVCEDFFRALPGVQRMIVKDVEAEFQGDPAAHSREEVIFSYPGLYAIYVYRIAHELYLRNVPFIPRIMTEYAHGKTGIDINAGATIGEYFFIDHGTGIVIGETTVIGKNVKIYQGVTLGALSTRSGQALSGKKRHPTIEDGVTIYANATILGGDTVIGEGATIGGNTFITWSVEKNAKVSRETPQPRNNCGKQ